MAADAELPLVAGGRVVSWEGICVMGVCLYPMSCP